MAEEQFTSRRARREAERQAAEQAFEAREVPEPTPESTGSRADLLSPLPPKKPGNAPDESARPASAASAEPNALPEDASSRIDPTPSTGTTHERGALATDHPLESRPPVNAEDRLDPTRRPLPHFETRAARKRYLREHGLSLEGDLSTGAMPVVAEPEEKGSEAAPGTDSAPVTDSASAPADEFVQARPQRDSGDQPSGSPTSGTSSTGNAAEAPAHESYDIAGFGGASEEVAARDFEAPVTRDSAPRPTTLDEDPYDALSKPFSAVEDDSARTPDRPVADKPGTTDGIAQPEAKKPRTESAATPPEKSDDGPRETQRSRRMPIVQPPSTSGVRVVTAASAQVPTVGEKPKTDRPATQPPAPERTGSNGTGSNQTGSNQTGSTRTAEPTATEAVEGRTIGYGTGAGTESASASPASQAESSSASSSESSAQSPDDAARALAANPETRPMDTVPEAWSLPNADYEDEEIENPPGDRIRASAVTGQDGQILMGEEPSKVPYIVLGVAAFFAIALIVVALMMFL